MATASSYMCLNGEIVKYEDCRVHAFSNAVKYGAGIFEGLRGYWNEDDQNMYLFRLREHWDRLRFGMGLMRFDANYTDEYLTDCVKRLMVANDFKVNVHIRAIAFLDCDDELPACGPVGLVVGAIGKPRAAAVANGINVSVSSWTKNLDNAMPSRVKACANYLNNRTADLEARRHGYDGTLILTREGKVSEGAAACFFMVRDGVIITPDVGSGILESVTRDTLIHIAKDMLHMPVIERPIDRTELYLADEAFFCASGIEVRPIVSIDKIPVGAGKVGPITKVLQDEYFAIAQGIKDIKPEWRTAVYDQRK